MEVRGCTALFLDLAAKLGREDAGVIEEEDLLLLRSWVDIHLNANVGERNQTLQVKLLPVGLSVFYGFGG